MDNALDAVGEEQDFDGVFEDAVGIAVYVLGERFYPTLLLPDAKNGGITRAGGL